MCFLFYDLGEDHLIIQENDKELLTYNIKNIEKNDSVAIILPDKDNWFGDDDYIKFTQIKGKIELNFENEKI